MTKAAKHFKKNLSHFWRSPETGEYLMALSELDQFGGIELAPSKKGRYGGTWCHPKLAVFFARWLDVRFAVWSSPGLLFRFPQKGRPTGLSGLPRASQGIKPTYRNKHLRLLPAGVPSPVVTPPVRKDP